jgi:hypothetical protein
MKKYCILLLYSLIVLLNTACAKKKESLETKIDSTSVGQKQNCENILNQLFFSSNFEFKDKYEVRIDEVRNDTIIIKAYTRNNLSDDPQVKQVVESVVGWFIIPPKKDALYFSLNALDPLEPNFKKIKTQEKYFKDFLNCNNLNNKFNNMENKIKFTALFNEGTTIKFTPNDLEKNDPVIKIFKEKLENFNKNMSVEDFDANNLSSLINNETFFDLQYYTDSSWLTYFIEKYKIDGTTLNHLMQEAISKEDFNAVKILLDHGYIVSAKDLEIIEDTKKNVQETIKEDKKEGYETYLVSESKIDKISTLSNSKFTTNKIQDPDGYTNLRKDKTATSEILQKIKSGEHIDVLDNTGDWFLIKTKEGKQGYVHKSRIKSN